MATERETKFDELLKKLQNAISTRRNNYKDFTLTSIDKKNEYYGKIAALRDKSLKNKKPKEKRKPDFPYSFQDVLKNNEKIENKEDLLTLLEELNDKYKFYKEEGKELQKKFGIMDIEDKFSQYRSKYKGKNEDFGKDAVQRLKDEAKEIELPLKRLSKDFDKLDKNVQNNFVRALEEIELNKSKRTNVKEGTLETLAKKRQEYIDHYKNLKDTAEKEQKNLENAADDWGRDLLEKLKIFDKSILQNPNPSSKETDAWNYLKGEIENALDKTTNVPTAYKAFLQKIEDANEKKKQKPRTMAEFNKKALTQPIPGTYPPEHTLLTHLLRNAPNKNYKDYDSFMKIKGNHPNMDLLDFWEKTGSEAQKKWEVGDFKDAKGNPKQGKSQFYDSDIYNEVLYNKYLRKEGNKKTIKEEEEHPLKQDILNRIKEFKDTNESKKDIVNNIEKDFNESKSIYEKRLNKQLSNDLQRLKMSHVGKIGGLRGSRYEREKEKIIEAHYKKFQDDMRNLYLKQAEIGLNDYKDKKVSLIEDINQKGNRYHNKKSNQLANNLINFSLDYENKNDKLKKKQDILKAEISKHRQAFPHLRNQGLNDLTSIDPNFSKDVHNEAMELLKTLGREHSGSIYGRLSKGNQDLVVDYIKRHAPYSGKPIDSDMANEAIKNLGIKI